MIKRRDLDSSSTGNYSYQRLCEAFREPLYRVIIGKPSPEQQAAVNRKFEIIFSKKNAAVDTEIKSEICHYYMYCVQSHSGDLDISEVNDEEMILLIDKYCMHMTSEAGIVLSDISDKKTAQRIACIRSHLQSFPVGLKDDKKSPRIAVSIEKGVLDSFVTVTIDEEVGMPHEDFLEMMSSNIKLKLHVSVDEKDIGAAWNALNPLFKKHMLRRYKVVRPGIKFSEICDPNLNSGKIDDQLGKEFTIYVTSNPEYGFERWTGIINEIIEALIKHNIPAGYETATYGDRADSRFDYWSHGYVSFRYEGLVDNNSFKSLPFKIKEKLYKLYMSREKMQPSRDPEWRKLIISGNNEMDRLVDERVRSNSQVATNSDEITTTPSSSSEEGEKESGQTKDNEKTQPKLLLQLGLMRNKDDASNEPNDAEFESTDKMDNARHSDKKI